MRDWNDEANSENTDCIRLVTANNEDRSDLSAERLLLFLYTVLVDLHEVFG